MHTRRCVQDIKWRTEFVTLRHAAPRATAPPRPARRDATLDINGYRSTCSRCGESPSSHLLRLVYIYQHSACSISKLLYIGFATGTTNVDSFISSSKIHLNPLSYPLTLINRIKYDISRKPFKFYIKYLFVSKKIGIICARSKKK